MSNHVLEFPHSGLVSAQKLETAWGQRSDSDDFEYVPISPWGPIALALGVLSLSAFYGLFGLILALFSTVVGITAVVKIRGEAAPVKGFSFALVGALLAAASLTLGSAKMAHAYSTECPEGYQRVNFPREIAAKQFVYIGAMRKLHPDVVPLVDQNVFLKGFMWQTQRNEGLTEFVLLKDNGECCFGGKAQPYDMMLVKLQDGLTTDAYTGMVAVAGKLTVNLKAGEDEAVYIMEATQVEEARTSF